MKIINKLSKNFGENKYIWLTFFISIFLFIIIFLVKSVAPFGKNTLLTVDFYHQYGPLLAELYDRIKNGYNLIYSFNTGLGLPIFRNFYNYLSSPFNIIMLFFKRDDIVTSYSIIISLKIIISSVTMAYFLKKSFNKNSILITIFGLSYAFSSYFVAFYWNIMWLDGLLFLPLITLGIKKIIDEDKFNLYIISLFLSIISNYFITYMLCIFSCIFFIIYLIFKENLTRKQLLKKIFVFTFSSILAGSLAAFMILPYASSLSSISATGDKFTFYKNFNFNIINFLSNHFSLTNSIVFSSQDYFLPNISSGIIVFLLVILFYFNSDIKLKDKIMASLFILILFISFLYVPLDFIWHGFHTPNDLPFRYSFIYVFILNIIAFYSLLKIDKLKIKYLLSLAIILGLFCLYSNLTNFLSSFSFDTNILLLIGFVILILLYKLNNNNLYKYGILFLVVVDIILNINLNWDIDHDKNNFMDNYVQVNSTINYIKNNDNSFYRIEKDFNQTLNDGAWYDYKGISIFSSVAYENMAKAQKLLGIAGNDINSYYYKLNTPIYNSLMSIKYLINTKTNNYYSYFNTINYNNIYENNYFLSPIIAVENNINNWEYNHANPFLNQQDFVYKATNIENIFDKLEINYDKNQNTFTFNNNMIINNEMEKSNYIDLGITAKTSGNIYLYVESYNLSGYFVNNEFYSVTTNEPYITDIGYYNEGDTVNIKFYLTPDINIVTLYAYTMNHGKFIDFYNILNKNSIAITNYKDNYIEGIIETDKDMTAFTSLNYDPGFNVYIDNQKVNTKKLANAFLSFDIPSGKHNIKIKYTIPYLKLGIIISGISLTILILINILKKMKKE